MAHIDITKFLQRDRAEDRAFSSRPGGIFSTQDNTYIPTDRSLSVPPDQRDQNGENGMVMRYKVGSNHDNIIFWWVCGMNWNGTKDNSAIIHLPFGF